MYRLETARSNVGAFQANAAWDVNPVAEKHGGHLADDIPGPYQDPPIERAWRKRKNTTPLRFGFARIKDYERWTRNEHVRKAFAEWRSSSSGEHLVFNVYQVPAFVAKSNYQALFERDRAKLIDSRDPANPRKRNRHSKESTNGSLAA